MSILTKAQIIEKNGKPIFAVIPYEDYLALLPEESDQTIPHEVVGLVIKKKYEPGESVADPLENEPKRCRYESRYFPGSTFSDGKNRQRSSYRHP